MNKKNKLKLLFKSLFIQLGSMKTDEGVQLLWNEDTELIVGYEVFIEQEAENGDLEYVPAPDGEYKSGNTTVVIADGKCTEIRNEEPAQEPEQPAEEMAEEVPAEPEQPAEETPAEPEQPAFDAEKAIADIRAEYDQKFAEMQQQLSDMRTQLDELLALPAEESAFNKETKEEQNQKPIFKSKK